MNRLVLDLTRHEKVENTMEGLDTLIMLIVIGAAIMFWQMFTERNPTIAPRKSYHPTEYYGD